MTVDLTREEFESIIADDVWFANHEKRTLGIPLPMKRSDGDFILEALNLLRSEEGSSVTILCDNPDFNGQPDRAIICCGDWTDWEDRRFSSDRLTDCFIQALRAYAEALDKLRIALSK